MSSAERRTQPRAELRLPISFRQVPGSSPVPLRGQTLDVSRTGVRFRADQFVPPGAFVAVELSLPQRARFTARGRTVWSREARGNGHWEVGATFLLSGGDADAALAEALLVHA